MQEAESAIARGVEQDSSELAAYRAEIGARFANLDFA